MPTKLHDCTVYCYCFKFDLVLLRTNRTFTLMFAKISIKKFH